MKINIEYTKEKEQIHIVWKVDNKRKQIIVGPAMIPNMKIKRKDEDGNYYYNFILLKNQVHTANIVGSCTLNLPNVSGSTKMVNCMIVFSLTSGQVLTMPSNIKWNYGVVPTFSTASGVKNRITFDTIDGGTTWTAYYAQIGS